MMRSRRCFEPIFGAFGEPTFEIDFVEADDGYAGEVLDDRMAHEAALAERFAPEVDRCRQQIVTHLQARPDDVSGLVDRFLQR